MERKTSSRLTIKEFAQALGVSTATVSRAIHGRGRISPRTREYILAQMQAYGFIPNLHAQSLVRGRSGAIALEYIGTMEVLTDYFLITLARSIQTQLIPHRYRLLLNLIGDTDYRMSVLHQWVASKVVDGVILVGNPDVSSEWLADLNRRSQPCVAIAYHPPSLSSENIGSVLLDTQTGWRQAVEYLLQLGHSAIGFVGTYSDDPAESYLRSLLHENNLDLPSEWVWYAGASPEAGYEIAHQIPATYPKPTALLIRTDSLAMGIVQGLQQRNVRIPDDLSIVSHDDIPLARWLIPPLTTIRVDYERLGQLAVDALLQRIDASPVQGEPISVPTQLMIRGTTAPPSTQQIRR